MTAPNQPPAHGTVDPLDARALYDAVYAYVSKALARMGCPDADLDDLAQWIVATAHRKWRQYDDTRGTPGQWLWGIARNEMRNADRRRWRSPLLAAAASASDLRYDVPDDAAPLEDTMERKDLVDFVWEGVSDAERRVLWDRIVGKATFDEIAALQGISRSRAQRLYASGMKRLRAALARCEKGQLAGVGVALVLADLFDMSGGPPVSPEALERGWQAMRAVIERDGAGQPPPSDDDGDAPPTSGTRVGAGTLRLVLGSIAGVVAGALLAGSTLPRCDRDRGRDDRPTTALAVAPAMLVRSAVADDADPSPGATLANVVTSAGMSLAQVVDGETGPVDPAQGSAARPLAERFFIDQARAALASNDAAAAVAALAQHARRYPAGRLAVEREGLRSQACAHLRAAARDGGRIDARCAGEP
jgi:RNA polymerase sigma factor (sigma-70 family)